MNRILAVLLALLFTSPAWAQDNSATPPPPPGGGEQKGHHAGLTQDEQDELHAAHDAALKANPDLEQEHKDLKAKMKAWHEKLKAAMIKADPKVQPLLDKLEAAHPPHDDDAAGGGGGIKAGPHGPGPGAPPAPKK